MGVVQNIDYNAGVRVRRSGFGDLRGEHRVYPIPSRAVHTKRPNLHNDTTMICKNSPHKHS